MRALATLPLLLALAACPRSELGELESRKEAAREPPPAPLDEPEPAPAQPSTLARQLDLVPAGADYLVIRDLRPLIDQARMLEQVLAGPLARALPELAGLVSGDAAARERMTGTLASTRSTLALVLAGLEGSGIALDRGVVVSEVEGEPLLAFAATDVAQLGTLARVFELDLDSHCRGIVGHAGWWACSTGDVIDRYRAGGEGERRRAGLAEQLPAVDIDRANLALALQGGDAPPLHAVLHTDAQLWSLSMPLPVGEGASLLAAGPAPALAELPPAASFTWLRFEPSALPDTIADIPVPRELASGELMFGPTLEPEAIVVQLGVADAGLVAALLGELAASLSGSTTTLAGVELAFEAASLELAGQPAPALDLRVVGASAASLEQALGLPARGRLWIADDHATLGWGHVDALPHALARTQAREPSDALLDGLPSSLAAALRAGEVAAVMHLVLDPWQAPVREAELAGLFVELPDAADPAAKARAGEALAQAFVALAPWSSASVWVARPRGTSTWLVHLDLVPFAAPGPAISPDELAASEAVLARVLAGDDADAAYRELLARWPSSPRATSWRARLGEAPASLATVGLLQAGLAVLVAAPLLDAATQRSTASEASEVTAAMLAAAVALREREGSCAALLGHAGPTPPLELDCSDHCRPGDAGYPRDAWTADPRWSALGWAPARGHRFHYALEAALDGETCEVAVRAHGDLDDDGVFSTYSRSATITPDGSQQITSLKIEGEGE